MTITGVTIVGVSGGFGRVFAERFARDQIPVVGVDVAPTPLPGDWLTRYVQADVARCDWADLGAAEAGRLILLCVPQNAVLAAMPRLLPALAPLVVAADIVSVKAAISVEFARHNTTGQYVSIHPLFGPSAPWAGQRWASVVWRDGAGVQAVERWLQRDASRVTRMTADEHDRATAMTQAAVHAAVLALGAVWKRSEVSPQLLDAVATPPTRLITALLGRLATADAELFRHLQHDNPHAAAARAAVAEAIGEMSDGAGFEQWMRGVIPPNAEALSQVAARLIDRLGDRA